MTYEELSKIPLGSTVQIEVGCDAAWYGTLERVTKNFAGQVEATVSGTEVLYVGDEDVRVRPVVLSATPKGIGLVEER